MQRILEDSRIDYDFALKIARLNGYNKLYPSNVGWNRNSGIPELVKMDVIRYNKDASFKWTTTAVCLLQKLKLCALK